MLDLHSHILPNVDDGAKSISEAIKILEMMKKDGITTVLATPHFYSYSDNLIEYNEKIKIAYNKLKNAALNRDLPRILLGTEVLYYENIGEIYSTGNFCLNNSSYLLLEITDDCITNQLFRDIQALKRNMGITVIIAHLERYYKAKGFRKFLKFIKSEGLLTQVNASSLFNEHYQKPTLKLIKKGYIDFIATDAHSSVNRPPRLKEALDLVAEKFGEDIKQKFISNSYMLLKEITEGINEK